MNVKTLDQRSIPRLDCQLVLGFILMTLSPGPATAAEFISLGFLDPSLIFSQADGSSADGSVVVGRVVYGRPGQYAAFRWTRDDGLTPLLPPSGYLGQGVVVSSDGSTVIWKDAVSGTRVWSESLGYQTINGFSGSNISADGSLIVGSVYGDEPAIWTRDAGVQILPNPLSTRGGSAQFVSPDGSVVVGGINVEEGFDCFWGCKPFRWSAEEGTVPLGRAPGDDGDGLYSISGMSADGSTVIGTYTPDNGMVYPRHVWRWTEQTGMSLVAEETTETKYRLDPKLSADGSVIASWRQNEDVSVLEVYRWTDATGVASIPGLSISSRSALTDISADGSVLLGITRNEVTTTNIPWIWTPTTGTQSLADVLTLQGLEGALSGWTFKSTRFGQLSDDGQAVIGTGTNPNGITENFVIYLDPLIVPEPSSLLLGIAGLVFVLSVTRSRCTKGRKSSLALESLLKSGRLFVYRVACRAKLALVLRAKQCTSVGLSLVLAMLLGFLPASSAVAAKGGSPGKPGDDPPSPPPGSAPEYSIEFLNWNGGDASFVYGMNNLGDVVGVARDGAGVWRSYLHDADVGMIDIDAQIDPNSPWRTEATFLPRIRDVNDLGIMVGSSTFNSGAAPVRITLPSDGSYAIIDDLGSFGGNEGSATGINNAGQIIGNSMNAAGASRGFFYTDASGMMDVGDFGGGTSSGAAINELGGATGGATTPDVWQHAFRYTPESQTTPATLEDLGSLTRKNWEGFPSSGEDVNDQGVVVGGAIGELKSNGLYLPRAFLARPGEEMIDLGAAAEGTHSHAYGINNEEWVVGKTDIVTRKGTGGGFAADYHAFLWSKELGMLLLEDLVIDLPASFEGRLQEAIGVNEAGQIIGHAVLNGATQAFLLSPVVASAATAVPEPSSLLLGALAPAGVGLVRCRRILNMGVIPCIMLLALFATATTHAAEFIPLGFLDSQTQESGAEAVSADGLVVAGRSMINGKQRAFRWTEETGMTPLLDTNDVQSRTTIISADGSTIAWYDNAGSTWVSSELGVYTELEDFELRNISTDGSVLVGGGFSSAPVRWSMATGIQELPLPSGRTMGLASFISADKSVVSGYEAPPLPILPVLWTDSDGVIELGEIPGDDIYRTQGLSDDGARAVGTSVMDNPPNNTYRSIWRWTNETGLVLVQERTPEFSYTLLPGVGLNGASWNDKRMMSSDGSVIAYYRIPRDGSQAHEFFRWTESEGVMEIPRLGDFRSGANVDMSADGSIVLGVINTAAPGLTELTPWLWTEVTGTRSLFDVLAEQGLPGVFDGWQLNSPTGIEISDDGNAIFGTATNPDGNSEAFVIYLDPLVVPEPSSLLLGTLALAGLGLLRCRRGCQQVVTGKQRTRWPGVFPRRFVCASAVSTSA